MEKLQAVFRDKDFFVHQFGDDVYAVGGYVRDLIRKIPSEEMDLLISHHSVDSIIKKLRPRGRVDLVGKSFGVIKFTMEGKTYDIALPRKDIAEEKDIRGHKDFIIDTDPEITLEQDLNRRDFRCNSITLRLADGQIIDPFNGIQDIQNKIINLTNLQAFPEDPLRVLRAARFASVLSFSVADEIYEISQDIDLSGLSVERINEEIYKILLYSKVKKLNLQ